MLVWPRRSGKDLAAFNIIFRKALYEKGIYYLVYPTFNQARRILWDSMTKEGIPYLNFMPREVVANKNSTEMKIVLSSGSIIQVLGSTKYDRLVGTSPRGIVYSEYALQDPMAAKLLRPSITERGGFEIYITTPRGHNHAWDLWNIATENPEQWFSQLYTIQDTGHVSEEEIEAEIKRGEISWDLAQQEYYCSWSMGVMGSYYARYIDQLRLKEQITYVPWEPSFPVHVAFDIGVDDSTAMVFFQVIGQTVHIIDCYEKNKEGLEHYTKVIMQKPYQLGQAIFPHDIQIQEFSTGLTRLEKARDLLGSNHVMIAPKLSLDDGIEACRTTLPRCWFDENNAAQLVKSLENYRQEYDQVKSIYKPQPLHDKYSHFADAFRYMCVSLYKLRTSTTADELDRRYAEAIQGPQGGLPRFFQEPYV